MIISTHHITLLFSKALALHQAGSLTEAASVYHDVLHSDPQHSDALRLLGTIYIQSGRREDGVRLIERSLEVNPSQADALTNLGSALQDMQRLEEALACYDKALAITPDNAEALRKRGDVLQRMRRYDEALASYDKAILLAPDYGAYNNRGVTLREMKRYGEALASCDKAILLRPDYFLSYFSRGFILQTMMDHDDALVYYDKALALNSNYSDAYYHRGNVLYAMKRHSDALASYNKALALNPEYVLAYISRGITLQDMMRYGEALSSYDTAIQLDPEYAQAHNYRGGLFFLMKRYDRALECYSQAIKLKPDYASVYNNQGQTYEKLKRQEDALVCYDKALALDPACPYLIGALLHNRMYLCHWQGLDALFDLLFKNLDEGQAVSSPFVMLTAASSLAQQKQCAAAFVNVKCPQRNSWNGTVYKHERIRLGYFSSDFQNHATSYLMAGLFELHDRSQFEVIGFSFGPPSDGPMRKRLEEAFDQFIDVRNKSDSEIAVLARKMEIDIAIDLKGFTQDSRAGILALRPAPVQVNYLGYPGTMAANYIDYIIADSIIIPPEHRQYYTERIIYLPDSYQVNDSSKQISERHFTRQEMGLPDSGFVFCCFNKSYKLTPAVFDIWMRLLHKVDGSVLWLFEVNRTSSMNLRKEARLRGIADERLVFAKRMDMADHLARHQLADLFLDTFHYNAHTTASDALWAGLPVLTYLGDTFASRVAASLLNAVNLPELVTHSHAEYESLAFELAINAEKLSALRDKLAQNRTTCPLFNTRLFTANLEKAYVEIWERLQAGLPAGHIQVKP